MLCKVTGRRHAFSRPILPGQNAIDDVSLDPCLKRVTSPVVQKEGFGVNCHAGPFFGVGYVVHLIVPQLVLLAQGVWPYSRLGIPFSLLRSPS